MQPQTKQQKIKESPWNQARVKDHNPSVVHLIHDVLGANVLPLPLTSPMIFSSSISQGSSS